jgi:hypothetical protein
LVQIDVQIQKRNVKNRWKFQTKVIEKQEECNIPRYIEKRTPNKTTKTVKQ